MILELKDINKSYPEGDGNPDRVIIKSLSLSIDYNESISIVGPSGCGKTTLLNIIGTLDKPDSGNVLINGNDITKMTDDELSLIRSNDIGFIFQSHHLLPQISVIENVKLPTIARKDINDSFIISSILANTTFFSKSIEIFFPIIFFIISLLSPETVSL